MSLSASIQGGQVEVVDMNDDVFMAHFAEDAKDTSAVVYRGSVFAWDDCDNHVCPSTGLIEEFELGKGRKRTETTCSTPFFPGTCLRLFFAFDRWYLCTNRSLSAFSCIWSTLEKQTFGALAGRALGLDGSTEQWDNYCDTQLRRDTKYLLWLVHEEYVRADDHGLYLLSTLKNTNLDVWGQTNFIAPPRGMRDGQWLPSPMRKPGGEQEVEWGYLFFDPATEHCWRETTEKYRYQQFLQGNERNPRRRYMQLEAMQSESWTLLADYLALRPSVADLKLQDDADLGHIYPLLSDPELVDQLPAHLADEWRNLAAKRHSVGRTRLKIDTRLAALSLWRRTRQHFESGSVHTRADEVSELCESFSILA